MRSYTGSPAAEAQATGVTPHSTALFVRRRYLPERFRFGTSSRFVVNLGLGLVIPTVGVRAVVPWRHHPEI